MLNMLELNKALKFLDYFSIITVSEKKVPNFGWKKYQTEKISKEKFKQQYEYSGGKTYKNKEGKEVEILGTNNFGIVTGFEDLECLDVDLKVLPTLKQRIDLWSEFTQNLRDNIDDFDSKFVIYKTMNEGYHVLYKTKLVEGNKKIARTEFGPEALFETRGIGGYIFTYPDKQVSKKSYFEIDYVSDDDRYILFFFAKSFDCIKKTDEPIKYNEPKKTFSDTNLKPWEDYNQKTDVFDIISNDFNVIGGNSKSTIIKRIGAESAHSGYVFKDSGCMYLFSTGTIYPAEKLLSPFDCYTIKNHNGNYSESASAIYKQGFGERSKKLIKEVENLIVVEKESVPKHKFPIEIFPDLIQKYIIDCNSKLDNNIDYMGCSLLWLISLCVGNTIDIEVKRGWNENASVWLSLVGKAGVGKTPSIANIIAPLNKINSKIIKKYFKDLNDFDKFSQLSKKEQKEVCEVKEPSKQQFIVNDITLEALVELHQESDNGIGVFKDELAGWLKDMNKYRAGSDLEFWLSSWSGKAVSLNRKTAKSSFVEKPFIPVLGGIQPNIFSSFYTSENKDNGFMDRMLLSFPDIEIDDYNENELDYSTIEWYNETIIRFYEDLKNLTQRNEDNTINTITAKFTNEAKEEWKRIFNKITACQNSENENEYLKSMYPKQKSYVPRFALLINVFDSFFDGSIMFNEISKASILKAEKLSDYFVSTAKRVKLDSTEISEISDSIKGVKTINEKLEIIYNNNKNFNRKETAELLGISKMTINRFIKKVTE